MSIRWIRHIALLAITVTSMGCAQFGGEQAASLQAGAKIGIVNLVGAQPSNAHTGTTVFNNFNEHYATTFDYREFIERELVQSLKNKTAYQSEVVALTPLLSDSVGTVECATWSIPLNDTIKSELSRIAAQQGIDMFLVAVSACGGLANKPRISGYGLYTDSFLSVDHAYAFSTVNYLRVMPNGNILRPYSAPDVTGMVMFESPAIANGQIRDLPPSELQRVDLMVQNLMSNHIQGVVSLIR